MNPDGITTSNELSIARSFVEARRKGEALKDYPGARPEDLASAYRIQDAALELWGRKVGGWKVGRIGPPLDAKFGVNRLAGPIFSDSIVAAGTSPVEMPVFKGGFAAAEAEFMLRLAVRPDHSLPTSAAEAIDWIDEVRIGIEVASSPYPNINEDGPFVTISDHGNNAGLVLGPEIARSNWDSLNSVQVQLEVDGRIVGRGTTETMLDGPFGAVSFLLQNLADRGIQPESGWWVSSGAITGVHVVSAGAALVAQFDELGSVAARTT